MASAIGTLLVGVNNPHLSNLAPTAMVYFNGFLQCSNSDNYHPCNVFFLKKPAAHLLFIYQSSGKTVYISYPDRVANTEPNLMNGLARLTMSSSYFSLLLDVTLCRIIRP